MCCPCLNTAHVYKEDDMWALDLRSQYTDRRGMGNSVNIPLWFGFKQSRVTRKIQFIITLNPNHSCILRNFCPFLSVPSGCIASTVCTVVRQ
jgi:hypothetical protein